MVEGIEGFQAQLQPLGLGEVNTLESDDQALFGLEGVLKVGHAIVHGISVLNLDGIAHSQDLSALKRFVIRRQWRRMSVRLPAVNCRHNQEVKSD